MILPSVFLILSLIGVGLALVLPGASDWLLLAAPCAIASLVLLLLGWRSGRGTDRLQTLRRTRGVKTGRWTRAAQKTWVIVDGSNVMHWNGGDAQMETLREVVASLTRAKLTAGVMFDANAGYKIAGHYMNDAALGRALGLPKDRVLIVPKGEPADPMILTAARDFSARIVTNDRFRDWAERFPEVAEPRTFVRGGYSDGKLWLDL